MTKLVETPNRWLPLVGFAALLVAVLSSGAERPNILYIFTDDQSDRTVSSYERAAPWVSTPNIDRLASKGVRFKHAYNGTWCMPARATFLTGKHQYGVESMRMEGPYPGSVYDPEKTPFWMSSFKRVGYTTAHIGKWHTGVDTGYGRDWDYQIVWNRPKLPENSGNYYHDQYISFNGGAETLVKGYTTDNYTNWAVEYLEGKGRDAEKPWLLWLCYPGTHGPFTPAERHLDSVPANIQIPLPADFEGERPGKPYYVEKRQAWKKGADGKYYTNRPPRGGEFYASSRQYQETAMSLDDAVGTLVETLERTGQLDNTLIIFTSDQGFAWGQHGFQHKIAPYDANISCPLIVSFKGKIPEGEVCEQPVGGHDLVPTIFNYAGVKMPWKMHGRDLRRFLENPRKTDNRGLLIAYTARIYGSDTSVIAPYDPSGDRIPWWVSYRQANYKYIMNLIEGETDELYDLETDSEELDNLALQPKFRKTVQQLRRKAIAELKRTDCPFVEGIPASLALSR